tara:strand:- start:1400 stop:1627 length:228 start_codon:yes stop_codon:yes gene_type:complete
LFAPSKLTCIDCGYRVNNLCSYFNLLKIKSKEIPEEIFNKGCKHYASEKEAKIIKHIMEVFKGEILQESPGYFGK